MAVKRINSCCCCSLGKCHGYKSQAEQTCVKSVGTSDDRNVLKVVSNGCEICGQKISPKEFCGVKRLRCPCHHVSGACGDGVFPSHSDDILGIIHENNVADNENDHGKTPSRNSRYPWLDWRLRPIISHVAIDEKHFTWHLKRRTPCIPDIYFQEMYDLNRKRYF